MIEVLSGFVLGLFGSLHCVGMCGPLVLALPMSNEVRRNIVMQSFIYNGGRAMTYAMLGLFMGSIGWCIELGGLQKIFSISIGAIMIYGGLSHYLRHLKGVSLTFATGPISQFINQQMRPLLSNRGNTSTYVKLGMLNGFIPCGLVYIALATSVTLGHPILAGSYMLLFGIGTIPLMALVMIGGSAHKGTSQKLRKYLPILTIILGIYLIWRGIVLYVAEDPDMITSGLVHIGCH
jgi:sulfite exporter TauE/SafE